MNTLILGTPGTSDERRFNYKFVFRDGKFDPLPAGGYIDVAKSRDPFNTPMIDNLEPGLLMGQTSGGFWAPSFFGKLASTITGAATSMTISAASAVELVRRVGTSGTFSFTGPPTETGTTRVVTVTYSAVNTSTGVVTITAIGINDVQTITFNAAATGGSIGLLVPKADGTMVSVLATWNTTDATYLANIQTALDTATGVANGIVVTGAAPDTALTFTASGTGYANLPQPKIQVVLFPTSTTNYGITQTLGVDGRFFAGSLVGSPSDGTQTPLSLMPKGYGLPVADGSSAPTYVAWNDIPIAGLIDWNQVIPSVTNASIRTWISGKMQENGLGSKFKFIA